jgi:hypothetical protein
MIARQLVKLDGSLPSLKLCMADVQAGKYKSGTTTAVLAGGKSNVPKALRDPTSGKPMAIIVDQKDKGPMLIDLAHSSIVGGGKKPSAVLKKTISLKKKPVATKKAAKATKKKIVYSPATLKLIKAKTLTPAQISGK